MAISFYQVFVKKMEKEKIKIESKFPEQKLLMETLMEEEQTVFVYVTEFEWEQVERRRIFGNFGLSSFLCVDQNENLAID